MEPFTLPQIQVGIDVGSNEHHIAISRSDRHQVDQFSIQHSSVGFRQFFRKIKEARETDNLPVAIAMEGCNGWARPLDQAIIEHGYQLYNVNNLKLARFKEIFPGDAKTDAIDAGKILELFKLQTHLPVAKKVLQSVHPGPEVNRKLKLLTRRRRQLVEEKVTIMGRLTSSLQGVSPGLLSITKNLDNLWFLHFLIARKDLRELVRMRLSSIMKIKKVGKHFAAQIQEWQKTAYFSPEVEWTNEMIHDDIHRILELLERIKRLNVEIDVLSCDSTLAQRILSIPGFGRTCAAELAGEIGTMERFASEASLALYVGMTNLENSSGKMVGSKKAKMVNRHAKQALMTAIARNIRFVEESRQYYDKKRNEGKRHNQAVRALGRHMVRVIWTMVKNDRDYRLKNAKSQ